MADVYVKNPVNRPAAYSSVTTEYLALTQDSGFVDRSQHGRLVCKGKDAQGLINRLSTNDLDSLVDGHSLTTILTSNKGRIIDSIYVSKKGSAIWVLTAPETVQQVEKWIDFYTIVEEVDVVNITKQTTMLSIAGPQAGCVLTELAGEEVGTLGKHLWANATIQGIKVMVLRDDFLRLPGYEIIADIKDKDTLGEIFRSATDPIGIDAEDVVRIEQGIPIYGKDLNQDYNPLEAGLIDHISFSKGCYVGQEVVARLNTYQKVQKYLVRLSWEKGERVSPGTRLVLEKRQVGLVTSTAISPKDGTPVGLGYVRKAYAKPDNTLNIEGTESHVRILGF